MPRALLPAKKMIKALPAPVTPKILPGDVTFLLDSEIQLELLRRQLEKTRPKGVTIRVVKNSDKTSKKTTAKKAKGKKAAPESLKKHLAGI